MREEVQSSVSGGILTVSSEDAAGRTRLSVRFEVSWSELQAHRDTVVVNATGQDGLPHSKTEATRVNGE